ncbi:MAG: NAD(P)H-dependent oxidoreductase [Candidatus Methanofastidiosia archaeon]
MKVTGVCGNPRKWKSTNKLFQISLNRAKELGVGGELIELSEYKIEYCNECQKCFFAKECPLEDDMEFLGEKIFGDRWLDSCILHLSHDSHRSYEVFHG